MSWMIQLGMSCLLYAEATALFVSCSQDIYPGLSSPRAQVSVTCREMSFYLEAKESQADEVSRKEREIHTPDQHFPSQ